jgi:DNA-binding NarL/FixJ family response regulator
MRIAIVEDHVLMGDSLSTVLRLMGHEVLVPALSSMEETAADLEAFGPQVVLLDLDLGRTGWGTALIRPATDLGARVVIMTGLVDESEIGKALSLGAAGWVSKSVPFHEFIDLVLVAASGGAILDELERDRLTRVWWKRRESQRELLRALESLSPKEEEVLAELMAGRSVGRIAAAGFVSAATVRTHVRGILVKLGVNSQLEAVALATGAGWAAHSHAGA